MKNAIELGWERLLDSEEACSTGSALCGVDLTSSQMLDPSCELSTQQATDFLANFDNENYFPHFDTEFEQVLTQVETSTSQYVTTSTTCTASVTMASTTVTSLLALIVCMDPQRERRLYNLLEMQASQQSQKKKIEWAVKVWKEWALARNNRLLSDEEPFSATFCELTVSEMDFWLSRFILAVRKKIGDPYPPQYALPAHLWFAASAT